MTASTDRPTVLLVEDNPADVRLAREAFDEIEAPIRLIVATDGTEAIEAIRGNGDGGDPPALVILDLNLPDTDGGAILSEVKSDDGLRRVPIIVFTTSGASSDVERMYDNYANAYVTKPDTVDEFITSMDHLVSFWFSTASLPEAPGRA